MDFISEVDQVVCCRAVDNFYSLGGHNRSECQCGLHFIGMPCTHTISLHVGTIFHNLI